MATVWAFGSFRWDSAVILLQSSLKSGDTVLELGCGTGRSLPDLARSTGVTGCVYGLEPQTAFVEEAGLFVQEQ